MLGESERAPGRLHRRSCAFDLCIRPFLLAVAGDACSPQRARLNGGSAFTGRSEKRASERRAPAPGGRPTSTAPQVHGPMSGYRPQVSDRSGAARLHRNHRRRLLCDRLRPADRRSGARGRYCTLGPADGGRLSARPVRAGRRARGAAQPVSCSALQRSGRPLSGAAAVGPAAGASVCFCCGDGRVVMVPRYGTLGGRPGEKRHLCSRQLACSGRHRCLQS